MRDVGKHFTVNAMLAKESVKRRIESEDGITYTEFSYSLLQAYDFLELYDRFGCTLQMGGSDQWGNITAGMDLIRRLRGGKGARTRHAADYDGVRRRSLARRKAGAIWLDPELTSPYQFYQFWLNVDDQDAVKYLRFFTFLSAEQIRGARGGGAARAGEAARAACAGARSDAAGSWRRSGPGCGSGGERCFLRMAISALTSKQIEQAFAGCARL